MAKKFVAVGKEVGMEVEAVITDGNEPSALAFGPTIETKYALEILEGKRFDNRKPDEFREITIETGVAKNAEGSARVKIGKTEVLVGVKMNIGEPYPDSPDKGNLMTTAELLPLSSPRIQLGRPGIESIELARVIDRGIRESKFIQLDKLCIKKGEKVWNVFHRYLFIK